MFGRVDFSEDREKKKERKWGKTFWMMFGWEGERGKKWWGSSVFSLDPPKSSPQNREKTGWREIWGVNDEIAFIQLPPSFFFFLVLKLLLITWHLPLFFFYYYYFPRTLPLFFLFSLFPFDFLGSCCAVVICFVLFCLFISFFV